LTGISGVEFHEASQNSVLTELDGVPVRLLGLESLLKNKAAASRPKDLVDFTQLKNTLGR
jgi:hypothetical protein